MKTHPYLILSLILTVTLLTIPTGQSASPEWTNNGVVWGGTNPNSGYYRPGDTNSSAYDDYPNLTPTTPLWTTSGGGTNSVTLDALNNFLNITTSGSGQRRYMNNNYWDASSAATLEFSLRINSQSGTAYAGALLFGNSTEYYNPQIGIDTNGFLQINGSTLSGAIATNFNTIRITLSDMSSTNTSVARIYVNNSTNAAFSVTSLTAGAADYIRFGDLSTSAAQNGSVDWGYLSWMSGQALPPIPEPTTTALILGGGILTWFLRRRKRA